MPLIRIATRRSPLALWQAHFVQTELERLHSDLTVELVPMVTKGDKIIDTPLAKIGGKGLFVKELEVALLEDRADIAVHSMKDVPAEFPEGLELNVICERENPTDAFVSNQYESLEQLPEHSVVGTASLRRQCQIAALRPDLQIKTLRGNVGTRLQKLDDGEFDAIILASAGLIRLGIASRIKQQIQPETMLPAAGQGAVGIECRATDTITKKYLAPLNHTETASRVIAERAMSHQLQGGCQVPIAAYAIQHPDQPDQLLLRGLVGEVNGSRLLKSERSATHAEATPLGIKVAADLKKQGAETIISQLLAKSAG